MDIKHRLVPSPACSKLINDGAEEGNAIFDTAYFISLSGTHKKPFNLQFKDNLICYRQSSFDWLK